MKRFIGVLALIFPLLLPTVAIGGQDSLPSDVFPDSRSRLPLVKPEDLHAQKSYAGAVANLAGTQTMASAIHRNGYRGIIVQSDSPLGLPLMQLVILATARENDQPYEWSLHEMQAIAVGLDPAVIDVVRNRKPLTGLSENEAVVIKIAREIFGTHRLSSATYAEGLRVLGKRNLVDIFGLIGDYAAASVSLSAFNQQMPPGWKQFLPLPFTPPDDIYADSRSRLALIRGRIPPAPAFATPLYGRDTTPNGTGPAYIQMHGGGLAALRASVGRPTIDLAILVTARELDSQYDWTMNEITAVKDGLDPVVIEAVRDRKPAAGLPEKDASLIDFARELFRAHYVTSGAYSRALKDFGEPDLVDLVNVMGQHDREAVLLAAFDQHLPVGQKPLLPLP
jgi:alkylhydroperoxidase family enzyme